MTPNERATARRKEETWIVLGVGRPRTLYGWWFWLRYWSPLADWRRRFWLWRVERLERQVVRRGR